MRIASVKAVERRSVTISKSITCDEMHFVHVSLPLLTSRLGQHVSQPALLPCQQH